MLSLRTGKRGQNDIVVELGFVGSDSSETRANGQRNGASTEISEARPTHVYINALTRILYTH